MTETDRRAALAAAGTSGRTAKTPSKCRLAQANAALRVNARASLRPNPHHARLALREKCGANYGARESEGQKEQKSEGREGGGGVAEEGHFQQCQLEIVLFIRLVFVL